MPKDVVCDPACGTAGFLVAVGESLRHHHPNLFHNRQQREHFHSALFHGFDFDSTMLRVGSMNLLLHGVEQPDIVYRDSLSQDHADEEEKYTLVLANPPFAGSLDYENTAKVYAESSSASPSPPNAGLHSQTRKNSEDSASPLVGWYADFPPHLEAAGHRPEAPSSPDRERDYSRRVGYVPE